MGRAQVQRIGQALEKARTDGSSYTHMTLQPPCACRCLMLHALTHVYTSFWSSTHQVQLGYGGADLIKPGGEFEAGGLCAVFASVS